MNFNFFDILDFKVNSPAKGKILLAEPLLLDPYFKRSVIFIAEHNEEGTVGFILNRSVNVKINELLPNFPSVDVQIHWGGPVNRNNLFYLHTRGDIIEGGKEVFDGLYWGGNFDQLKDFLDSGEVTAADIRFFAGYAGWDHGQLSTELEEKSWIVTGANKSLVMKGIKRDLWKKILTKMGRKYEIMANFPEDPTLN